MKRTWGAIFGFAFACLIYYYTAPGFGPRPNPRRQARILVEVDQLSQAVQNYKENMIEFPPCMADVNPVVRKQKLMRHMQLAFPNSGYGVTDLQFDILNEKIQNKWVYNFLRPDGSLGILHLETLDPAEALVFWLGGFPMPIDQATKKPIAGRRLFGLHRDSDHPFKRDVPAFESQDPLKYRTEPLYGFDENRLVDNDQDGWPEYVPFPSDDGKPVAPFVYFDGATYADTTTQRDRLGTCLYPNDPKLATIFGTAVPYLEWFNPQQPVESKWAKDTGFQIISAGLDGLYGPRGAGGRMPAARLSVFAVNRTYTADDGFRVSQEFDETELDNLTNLSSKPIGAAKE